MISIRSLFISSLMIGVVTGSTVAVAEPDRYEWLKKLNGDWVLAPAGQQEGKATQHKVVAPLVGTGQVAHSYRVTARGSTVQETLLPGTKKEMVTMFHCDNSDCASVKATHYCVKQNQPQLIAASAVADNTLVFDCDMNTELCRSGMDHIHTITLQLSDDGNQLKETYTTYKDGKKRKDSVYHFARK